MSSKFGAAASLGVLRKQNKTWRCCCSRCAKLKRSLLFVVFSLKITNARHHRSFFSKGHASTEAFPELTKSALTKRWSLKLQGNTWPLQSKNIRRVGQTEVNSIIFVQSAKSSTSASTLRKGSVTVALDSPQPSRVLDVSANSFSFKLRARHLAEQASHSWRPTSP